MSFGSRLKERREALGLKQSELGQQLGITGSAIGNYETGVSSPKADILYKVFDVLGCDANFLFQDEMREIQNASLSPAEIQHVKKYRALDEHGKRVVDYLIDAEAERLTDNISTLRPRKVIPLIGASFAAGPGEPDFGNGWEDYEVPADSRAEFALRVNGDSMEPVLHDGQIALGVKRPPEPGEVGAFLLDGAFLVKQCAGDNYGNVYLFSFNPAYEQIDVMASGERSLLCFGTVLLDRRYPLP